MRSDPGDAKKSRRPSERKGYYFGKFEKNITPEILPHWAQEGKSGDVKLILKKKRKAFQDYVAESSAVWIIRKSFIGIPTVRYKTISSERNRKTDPLVLSLIVHHWLFLNPKIIF